MRHYPTVIIFLVVIGFSFGFCDVSFSSGLEDAAMKPLNLGEITGQGWLKNQLRIQADGLSGHLDEFWPDIKDSEWFGGHAEGWERAPYWLDGSAGVTPESPVKVEGDFEEVTLIPYGCTNLRITEFSTLTAR